MRARGAGAKMSLARNAENVGSRIVALDGELERGKHWSKLLLRLVLGGFEDLVRGFVHLEAENAGNIGVFGRRRKALWEDVWEQVREGSAEISTIDVGTRRMNRFGVVEILASETEELYESLAWNVSLADWQH